MFTPAFTAIASFEMIPLGKDNIAFGAHIVIFRVKLLFKHIQKYDYP